MDNLKSIIDPEDLVNGDFEPDHYEQHDDYDDNDDGWCYDDCDYN